MAGGTPEPEHESTIESWEAWRRALPRPKRPMAPVRWLGGKGKLIGFVWPVLRAAGRVRGSTLRGEGAALANVSRTEVLWLSQAAAAACGVLL